MRQTRLIALAVACVTVVIAVSLSTHIVRRQSEHSATASPTVYNPYPPGILPSDLSSEIVRVQREVDVIEEPSARTLESVKKPDSGRSAAGPSEYRD